MRPKYPRVARVGLPRKCDLFGVEFSATTYAEVVDVLIAAAKANRPSLVDFCSVSVLVEGADNPEFREKLNRFDLVCPDGQPVRWALNHFHESGLRDTVCGTTTTLKLCQAAAEQAVSIYLRLDARNTSASRPLPLSPSSSPASALRYPTSALPMIAFPIVLR